MGGNKHKVNSKKGWKKSRISDVETFLHEKSVLDRVKKLKSNNNGLYEYELTNKTSLKGKGMDRNV